ncbi:conserved phage C-terminal domain-containing protein [Bacteroidales bacterium MSK.15.36]|nr:conserved phage C-terminal domain-containing protein [Bacteroidales bacterium MSK.15.36]
MDKGWIKLHRSIQEHWLFQEKRTFSKFEAWVDMIMMANHKDNKFLLGNELIEVKRGSFITSELKLMDRWNWSKTKVRNFLNLLESENMIIKVPDSKKTTIKIVKYELYQSDETIGKPEKDQQKTIEEPEKNHEGTSKELRKDTNKNEKNVKNDKNIYINIVEYLNQKANKNFKYTTKKTQSLINTRLKEKFAIDDFIKVIDIKCSQWLGTDMEKYLRPETLFGNKFEGYLNENIHQEKQQQQYKNKQYNQPKKTKFHNFEQRTDKYSADQLDYIAERKMQEHLERLRNQNAL